MNHDPLNRETQIPPKQTETEHASTPDTEHDNDNELAPEDRPRIYVASLADYINGLLHGACPCSSRKRNAFGLPCGC